MSSAKRRPTLTGGGLLGMLQLDRLHYRRIVVRETPNDHGTSLLHRHPMIAVVESLMMASLAGEIALFPDAFVGIRHRDPLIIRFIGIVGAAFFSVCAVAWTRRSRRPERGDDG